jgi:hypothetical protein
MLLTLNRNFAKFNMKIWKRSSMPEICRFYGIVIKMFYDEHNPPHFH